MTVERLDKILSAFGGMSRSAARELVKSGAVCVNGETATSIGQKCAETDVVEIKGKILEHEQYVYYMMNKPAGILSATTDQSCETVLDLLPQELWRKGLFPAGRLDKDTEGFVLITDDGAFAHKILSPKSHVPKKYFVRLDKPIPDTLVTAFAQGLDIGGGDICSPAELRLLCECEAEIVIYEGMYHQVKRMFSRFLLEVVYLKRTAIGGLALDPALALGEARKLHPNEMQLITIKF